MTTEEPPHRVPDPLRTVIMGAGRLMAKHSEGPSTKNSTRNEYRKMIMGHLRVVFETMRWMVEHESKGKRTLCIARRDMFAEPPAEDALMVLVVREREQCPENLDSPVTSLVQGDQLYVLEAPAGKTLALMVNKARAK